MVPVSSPRLPSSKLNMGYPLPSTGESSRSLWEYVFFGWTIPDLHTHTPHLTEVTWAQRSTGHCLFGKVQKTLGHVFHGLGLLEDVPVTIQRLTRVSGGGWQNRWPFMAMKNGGNDKSPSNLGTLLWDKPTCDGNSYYLIVMLCNAT